MSKLRIIALGAFMVFMGVAMVIPGSEERASARPQKGSEWTQHVDDRSVTLGEWTKANAAEKAYFCRAYTRAHLGREDAGRADDIRVFLDGSARKLRESAPDPRVTEAIFERQKIWTMAKAGARLMDWPQSQDS